MDQKICFVIMGFGRKMDPESGRTLDLNKTYEGIIKPAAEDVGLRCIRADEVSHSGVIDTEMYNLLLRSDLVIADISTGNANALYELGVRHALRPYSTIIMKEQDGKLYFDLSHSNIFHYKHLGDDIGYSEALRAQRDLRSLIDAVLADPKNDSPVYTYIPRLRQPTLSDEEFERVVDEVERADEISSGLLDGALAAMKDSNFDKAKLLFERLRARKSSDPFIIQQLALATYKSKKPSEKTALLEAYRIISELDPDNSIDPETLGITGAIRKNMYLATNELSELDAAIKYYKRGFEVRRDYYTGENYASCLLIRSGLRRASFDRRYDVTTAIKVCEEIIETIQPLLLSNEAEERGDYMWLIATMSNCLLMVGKVEEAAVYERQFSEIVGAQWERDTFEKTKSLVTNSKRRR